MREIERRVGPMAHELRFLRNVALLLVTFAVAVGPLRPCSLKLDPITQVGLPGEQGSLTEGRNNKTIILDQGQSVDLYAFWGEDSNSNGVIEGNRGEWTDVSQGGFRNAFAGKKMRELTSRGGFLDPRTFLGQLFQIKGGLATFQGTGGGESAIIKTPPGPPDFPWNPGSGLSTDYPVNLEFPLAYAPLPNAFWDFTSIGDALKNGGAFHTNGTNWAPYGGQAILDGTRFRMILPGAPPTLPDPTAWSIPANAWGSDWRVDSANPKTAYFPDREVGGQPVGGGWVRQPGQSFRRFNFKTVTDPRCFELEVDAYMMFVLGSPIALNWDEHQYTVTRNTSATAPTQLPDPSDPVFNDPKFAAIKSRFQSAPLDKGWIVGSSGAFSRGLNMLLAIQKTGRDSNNGGAARVGYRKILVRDTAGPVWNGYSSNTGAGTSPTVNMSAGSFSGNPIKVQIATRNPYWDATGPAAPIQGISPTLQAATSFHNGNNFQVQLRFLVQEVGGYQGVKGAVCSQHNANGQGVNHGNPDTGYCDCYAVPIPKFSWKQTAPFRPANIQVYRFNHKDRAGGPIATGPSPGGNPGDTGRLGEFAFSSILEFDLPLSTFNTLEDGSATIVGVNYGPQSQATGGGSLSDVLGRDTGVPLGTGPNQVGFPAWPADESNIPLLFAVVVLNDGSGPQNGQVYSGGSGAFNNNAAGTPWPLSDVAAYVGGGGTRFSVRAKNDSVTAAQDLAFGGWSNGVTLPTNLADSTVGYGEYGHYTLVDDLPPEVYIEVTDTKYDRQFVFGDHKKISPHADRAEYKQAIEGTTSSPGPVVPVPGVNVAFTAAAPGVTYTYADFSSTLPQQNSLVAGNQWFPMSFGYHRPGGAPEYPGYWVDEDTRLIFKVMVRDNINFYTANAGIQTGFTGAGLQKHPSTWAVVDAPAGTLEPQSFPEYTFRKPNQPGGGECSVSVSAQDQNGNATTVKVNFNVMDKKMQFFQLEEKRNKVSETETGTGAWWQN